MRDTMRREVLGGIRKDEPPAAMATPVPTLEVSAHRRGRVLAVAVGGELEAGTVSRLEAAVSEGLAHAPAQVLLNCRALTSVDGAAVSVLFAMQERARAAGARLILVQPSAVLMDAIDRADAADAFLVVDA